jgi:hypothetical protein
MLHLKRKVQVILEGTFNYAHENAFILTAQKNLYFGVLFQLTKKKKNK